MYGIKYVVRRAREAFSKYCEFCSILNDGISGVRKFVAEGRIHERGDFGNTLLHVAVMNALSGEYDRSTYKRKMKIALYVPEHLDIAVENDDGT